MLRLGNEIENIGLSRLNSVILQPEHGNVQVIKTSTKFLFNAFNCYSSYSIVKTLSKLTELSILNQF